MLRLIFLTFIIFAIACAERDTNTEANTKSPDVGQEEETDLVSLSAVQIENGGIQTAMPATRKLETTLRLSGSVDVPPQNIVSVSFPFGGYLKRTSLLPGMHVNMGEIIGVMEDQGLIQMQQDYLMARTRLNFLKMEYERQKTLQENQVNSAKLFQQVESEYNSQKVLVSGYAQKLSLIRIDPVKLTEDKITSSVPIYSPINGFVSEVKVNIGKFVNPTDVLFELINPDDMHAALMVFEKEISMVQKGQRVTVSLVDEPGKLYECEVILVTRNVNQDRAGVIHCHFEERPKTLLPGMFLNATVFVSAINALTVPEEAVVRYANQQYILQKQSDSLFRLMPVKTGLRQEGYIQLLDDTTGLASKPVVVKNAYAVLSKMKNTSEEE